MKTIFILMTMILTTQSLQFSDEGKCNMDLNFTLISPEPLPSGSLDDKVFSMYVKYQDWNYFTYVNRASLGVVSVKGYKIGPNCVLYANENNKGYFNFHQQSIMYWGRIYRDIKIDFRFQGDCIAESGIPLEFGFVVNTFSCTATYKEVLSTDDPIVSKSFNTYHALEPNSCLDLELDLGSQPSTYTKLSFAMDNYNYGHSEVLDLFSNILNHCSDHIIVSNYSGSIMCSHDGSSTNIKLYGDDLFGKVSINICGLIAPPLNHDQEVNLKIFKDSAGVQLFAASSIFIENVIGIYPIRPMKLNQSIVKNESRPTEPFHLDVAYNHDLPYIAGFRLGIEVRFPPAFGWDINPTFAVTVDNNKTLFSGSGIHLADYVYRFNLYENPLFLESGFNLEIFGFDTPEGLNGLYGFKVKFYSISTLLGENDLNVYIAGATPNEFMELGSRDLESNTSVQVRTSLPNQALDRPNYQLLLDLGNGLELRQSIDLEYLVTANNNIDSFGSVTYDGSLNRLTINDVVINKQSGVSTEIEFSLSDFRTTSHSGNNEFTLELVSNTNVVKVFDYSLDKIGIDIVNTSFTAVGYGNVELTINFKFDKAFNYAHYVRFELPITFKETSGCVYNTDMDTETPYSQCIFNRDTGDDATQFVLIQDLLREKNGNNAHANSIHEIKLRFEIIDKIDVHNAVTMDLVLDQNDNNNSGISRADFHEFIFPAPEHCKIAYPNTFSDSNCYTCEIGTHNHNGVCYA